MEGEKLRCTREGRRERADENRAAILRVSVRSDCEIILTGRGPGAAFPMMPAVLLRCRSTALQQHRIHTRTRSFKTVACPLRIIIWPCGSHICCFPLSDCGARDRAVVAQRSARLVRFTRLWLTAMLPPRALTSRGVSCIRAVVRCVYTTRIRDSCMINVIT